jgi:peroxiredoxin
MKYLKWILIIAVLPVMMVVVLYFVGGNFIKETTVDVDLEHQGSDVVSADLNKQSPFFELADLDGNTVKISDFVGTPLVVVFWTTWNTASVDQIKIMDDYLSKDPSGSFKIIAIDSQEDKSIVAGFVKRGGYGIKILLDETGAVGDLYGARNMPTTYFVDKQGVILDKYVGVLSEQMIQDKAEKIIR